MTRPDEAQEPEFPPEIQRDGVPKVDPWTRTGVHLLLMVVAVLAASGMVPMWRWASWALSYLVFIGASVLPALGLRVTPALLPGEGTEADGRRGLVRSAVLGAIWGAYFLLVFGGLTLAYQLALTCLGVWLGMFVKLWRRGGAHEGAGLAVSGHLFMLAAWAQQGEAVGWVMAGFLAAIILGHLLALLRHPARMDPAAGASARAGPVMDQLTEKAERLERDLRSQTALLAVASHDLRQPVHAASLAVECLVPGQGQAIQAEQFAALRRRIGQLADMVNSLMDVARLDDGRHVMRAEAVDIGRLVSETAADLQKSAEDKGLSLYVSSLEAWVRIDALLLRRMIWNLLSNAIKFTSVGSVNVYVEETEDNWIIVVEDTGPGMGLAKPLSGSWPSLGTSVDRASGLGVGLEVVRRSAQALGVELRVESTPGEGTRFEVAIPASAGVPESERELDLVLPSIDGHAQRRGAGHVLVIEDDELARSSMAQLVTSWGYRVSAWDGDGPIPGDGAAVERAPSLVITDLHLASAHGVELLAGIRARHPGHRVAAIIITGDVFAASQLSTQIVDAHVLVKPIRSSVLKDLVASILSQ